MAVRASAMLLAIVSAALCASCAIAATQYTVGGSQGWELNKDLGTWASGKKFAPGDALVFKYAASHSVVEVSKADYDSCQIANAIKTHSDGNTVVTLSSPGKRYFVCGTPGHCSAGMKVEIDTLAAASAPPASPPGNAAAPRASPPRAPRASPPRNAAAAAPRTSRTVPPAPAPAKVPVSSPPAKVPVSSPPAAAPPASAPVTPSSPPAEAPASGPPTAAAGPKSSASTPQSSPSQNAANRAYGGVGGLAVMAAVAVVLL